MYVLTELGYVLICQVKEKRKKKCSFENALVEKGESSTKNKNGLVEGLLLFSIQMFTFTDLSPYDSTWHIGIKLGTKHVMHQKFANFM